MFSAVVAPIRSAVRGLLACNSSGQLAAGFAVGMIIGLLPKGNLIALSLCVLLFSLRCNKGLAILAAVLFSFVGTWADPFAHKLGLAVLSLGPLQSTYASVLSFPLGAWLGFNNTVVTGSLLVGLYFAYPVYWAMRLVCSGIQRLIATRPTWHQVAPEVEGAP